jgi:hypothetical protein
MSSLSFVLLSSVSVSVVCALSCWSGTSLVNSAVLKTECPADSTVCISYDFKCQASDSTCVAGTPFAVGLCGTQTQCDSVKFLPDASNTVCCNTDNCNTAVTLDVPAGTTKCFAAQTIPGNKPTTGWAFCGAGKSCSYYETLSTGDVYAMCAGKDVCDSITSPQAALSYKNAKCCNTANCNAPSAATVQGTTPAPAAGPGAGGKASLSCWVGVSLANSGAYKTECPADSTVCISYNFKCQASDTTCVAGTPFVVGACGTQMLCDTAKLLPDASNTVCCNTDNCNTAVSLDVPAGTTKCFAAQTIPGNKPTTGWAFCGAGKSCSYYETLSTGDVYAMCADKDLCDSITSPQAALSYKNAKCCNTANCNAPVAATATSATKVAETGAGGAASVQTLSSIAGLMVVAALVF